MWGQSGWAMPCPRVPALLLLVVGTGVSTQDMCSSRADGALQAPVLFLNASSAQEGDVVLAQCVLQELFPATRIVFCKDGLEASSLKVQEGRIISSMLLNITERSSGTYTCFYQQRNEKNWLRSSVLSAPWHLQVTGHVSDSTGGSAPTDLGALGHSGHPFVPPGHGSTSTKGTAHTDAYTQLDLAVTAVASVAVTLLLSAASYWILKKGACRERCQRAEESSADHASYYANVDERRRVKASGINSSEVCT